MIHNIAFYKFVSLSPEEMADLRKILRKVCSDRGIKGSILLGTEGINGTLAGHSEAIEEFVQFLKSNPKFSDIAIKVSFSERIPFGRMLVKLKKEIISMGCSEINPEKETGPRVDPRILKEWLDQKKDILLLDTRNNYEIEHGTFEGAISLGIKHFREFPKKLENLRNEIANKTLVMFCTGGIRCEKATAIALREGFRDVFQLEGGILNYFEKCGDKHYKGDCFVFDERVVIKPRVSA